MAAKRPAEGSHDGEQKKLRADQDEYFMAMAFLAASQSMDPKTKVGACIVDKDQRIVGVGYNKFPNGLADDYYRWKKKNKHYYVCHAEMNAILNANSSNLEGCKLYVKLFPCDNCSKLIIRSKIAEVIYKSDKNADRSDAEASKQMLKAAGVFCRQYPGNHKIEIQFLEYEN